MKHLLFVVFLFIFSKFTIAQNTEIRGVIYEDSTTQTLSFVKVFFKGSQIGTTTDSLGKFHLSIPNDQLKTDTIIVNLLGFKIQQIPIQKGSSNVLEIHLMSSMFLALEEVTAVAGENIAWRYLRKIIANKPTNNPSNLDFYSSKEYSKVRFDLNNFTDNIKKNILLKPFDYIWDNTQTTEDGVRFLPVLLTENVSEHYYRKSPKDSKDIVVGEKTTGLAGPNLTKFTKDLYFTPNIYENYVTILDKSFPSPLNDNYQNNYKFYIIDSIADANGKTYQIRFRPKHKHELAFTGEMFVDSASYAVKEINLRFDLMANVNFVRSYMITQKYDKVDGEHWMMTESQVLGDFTVLEGEEDMTGFFGRKKAVFSEFTINQKLDDKIFKGVDKVIYDKEILDTANWEVLRTDSLSMEEQKLLLMTERVKDDPAFKARKIVLSTIATGYIPLKHTQIGDLFTFYNYNPVEFSRFKLGFRSDPKNEFPLSYSAYLAYGIRDAKFKYGATLAYNFTPKKKATRIGATYHYDIQQVGRSFNQIQLDHFVSSLNQEIFGATRNYVNELNTYLEKEIVTGVITRAGIYFQEFEPTRYHSFEIRNSNNSIDSIQHYSTSGIDFTFKFSHLDEKIIGDFYDKKSLYKSFRKFPEVALNLRYGNQQILPSDFDYTKIKITVRQKVRANKLGHFTYNVEAGKTFGILPYFMLDVPFGNELILNDVYSYNLMNYMEFLSDQFVAIHLEHHFDGLILDRIPLVNKLKWRGFVFGKGYFGSLSDANRTSSYIIPTGTKAMTDPYYEVGFGIENIFKFAKIDFIWRLTPGTGEYYYFMIKPSFKFSF